MPHYLTHFLRKRTPKLQQPGVDNWNGPVIDEQIIGDVRPDPHPLPPDSDQHGGGGQQNLMDLLTQCLSLLSLARQCYDSLNSKPDEVVSVNLLCLTVVCCKLSHLLPLF